MTGRVRLFKTDVGMPLTGGRVSLTNEGLPLTRMRIVADRSKGPVDVN